MIKIYRWLPAIVWMALIFYLSSRTTSSVGDSYWQNFLFYKTLHLIEYAILAVCLYIAKPQHSRVLLLGYLYAVSDEIHQFFTPGRSPKFSDTLVDLLGLYLGLIFIKIIISQFPKLKKYLIT